MRIRLGTGRELEERAILSAAAKPARSIERIIIGVNLVWRKTNSNNCRVIASEGEYPGVMRLNCKARNATTAIM